MTSRKLLIDNVRALKNLIDEEQGIPDQLIGAGIPILTGYGGGLVAGGGLVSKGGAKYGFGGAEYGFAGAKSVRRKKAKAPKMKGGAPKKNLSKWQLYMKKIHKQNPDIPIAYLAETHKDEYHRMKNNGTLNSYLSGKSGKAKKKRGGYIYG